MPEEKSYSLTDARPYSLNVVSDDLDSVQDLADDLEHIDPWLLSTNKLIVPVITDIEKDLEQRHDLNR